MKTKEHTRQVRDTVVEMFKAGFGYKKISQALNMPRSKSGLFGRVARGKPFLKDIHKKSRLKFATSHLGDTPNMWKKVLWSDETKTNATMQNDMFGVNATQLITLNTPFPLSNMVVAASWFGPAVLLKIPAEFQVCPGRRIGGSNPCFLITEIGQNHQRDDACGVDCVKFQKSELEHRFTKHTLERAYSSPHSRGNTYGAHKRHLEFSHEQYRELQHFSAEEGIFFTASAMDDKVYQSTSSALFLARPMVISSGMQTMETISCFYDMLKQHNPNLTFLQCTSAYPLPTEYINLCIITEIQREFPDNLIGYSGHEEGTCVSVTAVAMGAKVVERHVTLDKSWKCSDHAASLEPSELAVLVREIQTVELALGSPVKQMLPGEASCHSKVRYFTLHSRVQYGPSEHTVHQCCPLLPFFLFHIPNRPYSYTSKNIFKLVGMKITMELQKDDTITRDIFDFNWVYL
ncbi:LOW QUALITY PROTEIN: N-acetylneuraminic acid synthase b [Hoplias malabaricus]|uniref:LOW QUALITY PROTEIN: N-acetylneuraminic acid synthase b n=1 Tax=Hoplias malabaricus TaxID=27720 RepID=UPI0034620920